MRPPGLIRRIARRLLGRSYDAASGSGRWAAWSSLPAQPQQALMARWPIAVRAKWLADNVPLASGIVEKIATNVIGDGPAARSAHENRAMRRALEAAWRRFYSACDHEGAADLCGLLGTVVRSLVVNGEAFVAMRATRAAELRLQLLSTEQIDPSMNRDIEGGHRIVAGVEFDADGRRVAYWVLPEAPDAVRVMVGPPVRVPASEVLHVFERRFVGQVRGLSWLAPVATRIVETGKLEDALLARANTAALFGAFVRDPEGSFATGATTDPAELSLEPGAMRILPPGTEISFPNMPDVNMAGDLLRHVVRAVCAGCGVPYEVAFDVSQANYSASKLALQQYQRRVKAIQASLIVAQLLEPVWRRMAALEVLSGRINADLARDIALYDVRFLWPGWASLDPLKDAKADVLHVNAGLRSRAELIAERGRDPEDVFAEIQDDPRPDVNATATSLLTQPENQDAA